MSRFKDITTKFLQEIHSKEMNEWLQELKFLSNGLEDKIDPEPIELQLVDSVYKLFESYQQVENIIKQYNKNSLPTEKLSSLYDKENSGITDILFD